MKADFVKIIVKDSSDRKIDTFTAHFNDKEASTAIIKILITKYGMRLDWAQLYNQKIPDFLSLDSEFLKF